MPDQPALATGRSPLDDVHPLPDEQPERALADDLHDLTAIWPELWTVPFGGLARELVKRGWRKP